MRRKVHESSGTTGGGPAAREHGPSLTNGEGWGGRGAWGCSRRTSEAPSANRSGSRSTEPSVCSSQETGRRDGACDPCPRLKAGGSPLGRRREGRDRPSERQATFFLTDRSTGDPAQLPEKQVADRQGAGPADKARTQTAHRLPGPDTYGGDLDAVDCIEKARRASDARDKAFDEAIVREGSVDPGKSSDPLPGERGASGPWDFSPPPSVGIVAPPWRRAACRSSSAA